MILSGPTIARLNILDPCYPKYHKAGISGGLSYCGYDLCLFSDVSVFAGKYALAVAEERFTMPNNVVGFIHDKSTWARMGLMVQNTVVEPGWKGYLTLELTNHSEVFIEIAAGTPIAQVVFSYIDEPSEGYSGKYQNQGAYIQEALLG